MRFLIAMATATAVFSGSAADWPQLLGPARNGISSETNLSTKWPAEGPPIAWKFSVGEGWSGPTIASNRVMVFHRRAGRATLDCLDATTGKPIWQGSHATDYRDDFGFDEGPRATPTVDSGRVFTFGAEGRLSAWELATGKELWSVNTAERFGAGKGFFGRACSPLVEGNAVIVNIGGNDGAGVAAFEKSMGKLLWKATSQEASYASPTAATMGGRRYLFVLGRSALVALDPGSGKSFWEHPFEPTIRASVTAATPLVIGETIFISGSYGAGAQLLRFDPTRPSVVWSRGDVLANHYSTSLHHAGFLYGFDGRQEERCHLRCVELATGKVRWSKDHFGAGSILGVGNHLVVLTEGGELMVAAASPAGFQPLARAQILGSECRAYPAFTAGRFYARDKRTLACVDLRAGN